MATVLRVKRKADEDAASTIVLASKKAKIETENSEESRESYVFSYAGTFKDPDSEEAIETLKNVRSARWQSRNTVKSIKTDIITKIREEHAKASREKRLQLLLSHRAILDEIKAQDTDEDEFISKHQREYTGNLFRMYNVAAHDESEDEEQEAGPASEENTTVTCNGVPMVRCPVTPETSQDDYVYDVYLNDAGLTLVNQESYIVEKYIEEFVPEAADESDLEFDDDSDSNSESNWRNDYPDEDAEFEKRLDYYDDYSDDGGDADCITDRLHTVHLDYEDEYDSDE